MENSSVVGKHWSLHQKKGMGVKLTEAEKIKLAKWEVIPLSDKSAICNHEGWELYQKKRRILMNQVRWIYNSKVGELEVWAETKEDAAKTLREYGINVDLKLMKLVPPSPQDLPGGEID